MTRARRCSTSLSRAPIASLSRAPSPARHQGRRPGARPPRAAAPSSCSRARTRRTGRRGVIPFAYVEAAANLLTNPKLDPFGKIPEFKFCAAKVEAVDPMSRVAAE